MSGEAYAGNDFRLEEAVPVELLGDLLSVLPRLAREVNLAASGDTSDDRAAAECYVILRALFDRHLDDDLWPSDAKTQADQEAQIRALHFPGRDTPNAD